MHKASRHFLRTSGFYTQSLVFNLVLRYLKFLYPHGNLFLKQHSYKLILLLALTTGQRIQTLYFIDLKMLCCLQILLKYV